MLQQEKKRTNRFRWSSRHELYSYFNVMYSIPKNEIDEQINKVMESFRPRKGVAINIAELWQKVGLSLEMSLGGGKANSSIDNLVIYEIAQMRRDSFNNNDEKSLPPQPNVLFN